MSEAIPKKTPVRENLRRTNSNYTDLWSPIPTDLIGAQQAGKKQMEITSYWRLNVEPAVKPVESEVNPPHEQKSLEGRPETKIFKSLRLSLGKMLKGDK